MRIVQVGPYPLDPECTNGGVEASVYGLSNELSINHKVLVIDLPRINFENDYLQSAGNVNVLRVRNKGNKNRSALSRVPFIVKEIQNFNPRICHIHGTNFFQLALYLMLRIRKIPVIVTVHGLLHVEQYKEWRNNKTATRYLKYLSKSITEFLILSLSRQVIVDTKYVADQISTYRRMHKIWRQPVCKVIPQGIDNSYFSIPDNFIKTKLLSVGSICRRKGYIKLLEVLNLLNSRNHYNISLDIAGILVDNLYYGELLKKIDELGLNTQVNIHTDLPVEKIKALYEFANIFVLHSEEESQGIVLCEAMACGKPIVATNSGGIPDIIKHGSNGFLSEYSDIETFCDNVQKLLIDDALRKQISDINRLQSRMYSWQIIRNSIIELYNSILPEITFLPGETTQ